MASGRGLPSVGSRDASKADCRIAGRTPQGEAAAALAQDQESIRAHDCLKSLGITLIPASAPDFFLV
jgi:hypothetical protein